jgi:hypothetical protein
MYMTKNFEGITKIGPSCPSSLPVETHLKAKIITSWSSFNNADIYVMSIKACKISSLGAQNGSYSSSDDNYDGMYK